MVGIGMVDQRKAVDRYAAGGKLEIFVIAGKLVSARPVDLEPE